MALSSTSFNHASTVARIKEAIICAARRGTRQRWVRNRKGVRLVCVVYEPGVGFRFYHERQGNVSALVVAGARKFHAGLDR